MPEKRSTNEAGTYKQGRSVGKHAAGAEQPHVRRVAQAPKPPKKKAAKGNYTPILIGVLVLVVLGGAFAVLNNYNAPGSLEEGQQVRVEIAQGSNTRQIAESLLEAGLIGNEDHFANTVSGKGVGEQLKSGSYSFTGGMSEDEIIEKLIAGPQNEDGVVTIPEGSTLPDVAKAVHATYGNTISEEDFLKAANDASAYVADFPFVEGAYNNSLEGFLFPKTYPYLVDASADAVIRQMLEQYQTEMAKLDYSYPEGKGLNAYETLILASIVQREANVEQMPTVASVFYNRLDIDMALQSDATTAYAIGGDPTPEDLKQQGPFNTYLNKGLPPGPINSPSLDALKAVCAPASTEYLFFYFKKDDQGVMQYYYSKTHEEHEAAIREH